MDEHLLWGLGLLGASILLVLVELFIPSGGVIAILAGLSSLAGVVALFMFDTVWGFIGLFFVLIGAPIAFFGGLSIWQNTPIGRAMIGAETEEEVARRVEQEQRERDARLALVGEEGVAVTDLHPVGIVKIGGQRLDAIAETTMIDSGAGVRVTSADGLQIKVRQV